MKNLIEMRIGKYERDLAAHRTPLICECDACKKGRVILTELRYMEMAERHLSARATSQDMAKDTSCT